MTLFSSPFRIFFLLCPLAAIAPISGWIFVYLGLAPVPELFTPAWHAHELLYGLVPAAAGGFLLTAIPHWTGTAPVRPRVSMLLAMLWLLGRAAMWFQDQWPMAWVVAFDLSFLVALSVFVARPLIHTSNRRNFLFIAIFSLWLLGNIFMHAGWAGLLPWGIASGERLALGLITVMMVVIGGRITPTFSINWLRQQQKNTATIRHPAPLMRACIIMTALWAMTNLVPEWSEFNAMLAGMTAILLSIRLYLWRGWLVIAEPMLWILHLGQAWIIAALVFRVLAEWHGMTFSVWQHALGAGAMGTLILGVMTRVALGHTGRIIRLPKGAIAIYILVLSAGVSRVAAAIFNQAPSLIKLAAVTWLLAFSLYILWYLPVLVSPRADGRPG